MPRSLQLSLSVNGEAVELSCAGYKTLLEVLREDLGLTGTKHGCELGECGACAVLIDGAPQLSCLVLAAECEGRAVETVEGLSRGAELHPLHAHALIEEIDTEKAKQHPGVHLVLTGKDFPVTFGILPVTQDEYPLAPEHVRYVGDPVAAVVAKDEQTATQALDLIQVRYRVLDTISNPEEALAKPEPRIHAYSERGNIHRLQAFEFGNVEEAFARSDHVFEDLFFYDGNTHLPIEQHAAVAAVDGGGYGSYGVASTFYTGALQTVTYELPRYKFDAARVFTNKPPCGPKRGHGTPQPRFGQEVQLDKIAEKLGIDPAVLRLGIVAKPDSLTANWLKIGSIGLAECIRQVVARSDWKNRFKKLPYGRGVGIACGSYLCGAGLPVYWNKMPQCGVQLLLDRSGQVTVFCGATEIGP